MPDLGNKYECYHCGAKFYDLGRSEPLCPKCGANQKDAKRQEQQSESAHAKRKKREEVVRLPEVEEELVVAQPDDDFPEEEMEAPEGVETEEVVEDFDDDEE